MRAVSAAEELVHQKGPHSQARHEVEASSSPLVDAGMEPRPKEDEARVHGDEGMEPRPKEDEARVHGDEGMEPRPKEDEARVRALFESMDRDQDGLVNRIEAIKALRSSPEARELLGLAARFTQGSAEHTEFERVFQGMDRDDSRAISWEEFREALLGWSGEGHKQRGEAQGDGEYWYRKMLERGKEGDMQGTGRTDKRRRDKTQDYHRGKEDGSQGEPYP